MKSENVEQLANLFKDRMIFPDNGREFLNTIIKYLLQEHENGFGCEKEFQFELAWAIRQISDMLNLGYRVYFEYVAKNAYPTSKKRNYIDLAIEDQNKQLTFIELKHKLTRQAAYPYNVYLFLKDVARLETLKKQAHGFAVFLTDGDRYSSGGENSNAWSDFCLKGKLEKQLRRYKGHYDKYKPCQVELTNEYDCDWEPKGQQGKAQYLIWDIK